MFKDPNSQSRGPDLHMTASIGNLIHRGLSAERIATRGVSCETGKNPAVRVVVAVVDWCSTLNVTQNKEMRRRRFGPRPYCHSKLMARWRLLAAASSSPCGRSV